MTLTFNHYLMLALIPLIPFVIVGLIRSGSLRASTVKKKEFEEHKAQCQDKVCRSIEELKILMIEFHDKNKTLAIELHDKNAARILKINDKVDKLNDRMHDKFEKISSQVGELKGSIQ